MYELSIMWRHQEVPIAAGRLRSIPDGKMSKYTPDS
jgi:hypothetical protein